MPNIAQASLKPHSPSQKISDNTSPDNSVRIPAQLKYNFEQMSGLSFEDVQIHYSSSKPATIGAQAYAMGNHVYLGPGQERHLPHEFGHVLQQKQGRVSPTIQVGGMQINQDISLEQEADWLGHQALQSPKNPDASCLSVEPPRGNVIQGHGFFTDQLSQEPNQPLEWLNNILRALGITEENALSLINQHMNFNKMNDANAIGNRPYNTFGYTANTTEATITDFILAQLGQIKPGTAGAHTSFMQMGAVLNGISRMLAHKLGDLSASDHILQKIMERLPVSPDDAEESRIRNAINAFAKGNPILMYLHNEINSHDAAVMLLERAKALGMNREDLFRLMEQQASIQLTALKSLQTPPINVSAARTYKLAIDDAIGLYSKGFIANAIADNGKLNDNVDKLKTVFLQISEDAQMGKYRENPTLEKAHKHEAKSFTDPDRETIKSDLLNKAKAGVKQLHDSLYSTEAPLIDAQCLEVLDTVVNALRDAPVCITRFASDLLSRELSPQLPVSQERALKAGTPLSYITLDELIQTDKKIRYHRPTPGEAPEIAQNYFQGASHPAANTFPYTALLSEESLEGRERGISYPIFRSNKNRLFAGKQQNAPSAIFGTLNLLGEHNYYGLKEGKKAGTYGDVVLIFRKNVFQNKCMYTLGDRMRGYTNLKAFVYNAFSLFGNDSEKVKIKRKQELLIPGYDSFGIQDLAGNLLRLGLKKSDFVNGFEQLEVQIFDTVKLTRDYISEVYFSTSVPNEQREQIKSAIMEQPLSEGLENTRFYQYRENECLVAPCLPMNHLYYKDEEDEARPQMSIDQVKQLLTAENYQEQLIRSFGFHKNHKLVPRTSNEREEFQQILAWFEKIRQYMGTNPNLGEKALEDIINGRVAFRVQIRGDEARER